MGREKNHSKYYIVPYSPFEGSVVSHGYDNTGGVRLGVVDQRGGGREPGGGQPHPPPGSWQLLFNDRPAYLHKRNQEI